MSFIIGCHGPWCHFAQAPPPQGPPSKHRTRRIQLLFSLPPYFQLVCLFSVLKSAHHTHTVSGSVGGYFYKGLFPKYTACPITDTLTASHVTRWEASGHWLTVLRITRASSSTDKLYVALRPSHGDSYPNRRYSNMLSYGEICHFVLILEINAMSATFCVYRKWIPEYSLREKAL